MTRRTTPSLLGLALLVTTAAAVSADEPAPPWFGERIETADFTLTIPAEWVAVDVDGDLGLQAEAIAEQVWITTGACAEAACADDVHAWLQGEDETVQLLATGLFGDDGVGGTCRVHHVASLQDRPLGEYAGIIHDVFAGSPGVEVPELPRAVPRDDGSAYTFDFSAPAGDVEGTVYLVGGSGRFGLMRCEGSAPPPDRWHSLTETLALVGDGSEPAQASVGPPELQAALPVWVAGRPLLSYSERGLDYLRQWSRIPEEELRALEDDPHALDAFLPSGTDLDDIEFANAGRAATDHPPHFVTALRIRGVPAAALPVSMVVDHDVGTWTEARFGDRVVRVGTDEMLDQWRRPGRPYVFDGGDVRFVVTTDDETWAREAIARLRPEATVENAPLFVSLPEGWRAGLPPTNDEDMAAVTYGAGLLAAHDGEDTSRFHVPTLEIHYTGTRLDTDVAETLDGWMEINRTEPWPGRTLRSLERVSLPAGEALRFEMTDDADEPETTIAEVLYRVATPAGVFDLLFSVAADDLIDHSADFEQLARSFMAREPEPDSVLAQLARGELTRTEYEMLAGGYMVVPG